MEKVVVVIIIIVVVSIVYCNNSITTKTIIITITTTGIAELIEKLAEHIVEERLAVQESKNNPQNKV